MCYKKYIILSTVITLCAFVKNCNCMSVGALNNGHNITKRNSEPSDFYPDWVPFKNKNGDELGEFTEVTRKSNLKKRLALPVNFRFSAMEGEADDYFEKGGGEAEEYFEKRDWTDVHRTPAGGDKKPDVNREFEDIDGLVVHVEPTTATVPTTIVHEYYETTNKEEKPTQPSDLSQIATNFGTIAPPMTKNNQTKRNSEDEVEIIVKKKPSTRYEDEIEYEDGFDTKIKKKVPEIFDDDVPSGNERRHKILDLVDDLKEQHRSEQRVISEKMKEEELSREEHDQTYGNVGYDKYASQTLRKKLPLTFEEYDELGPEDDKYKLPREIFKIESTTTTFPPITTTPTTTTKVPRKSHVVGTGKLSFFRNPSLFMVYEDDKDNEELFDSLMPTRNETSVISDITTRDTMGSLTTTKPPKPLERSTTTTTTTTTTKTTTPTTTIYQSVYTAPWTASSLPKQEPIIFNAKLEPELPERKTERISLVPISPNLDENEPALFFPKPRKVKPKNKSLSASWSKIPKMETKTDLDTSGASAESKILADRSPSIYDINQISADASASDVSVLGPIPIETSTNTTTTTTRREPEPFSTGRSNVKIMNSKAIHRGAHDEHIFPTSVVIGLSASDSIPSAADTAPSAVAPILNKSGELDTISAPSETKEHKPETHEHESGGGHEHDSEHEEEHSEHGKKAYEGLYKDSKSGKGHHNKEDHLGKYHDHGGFDKKHHDESGHEGEHLHEEHGKKHAQYEESGKHSKGHSTKGSHDIHKKEEYEKKVEFFEEDGDMGEEEKHGGYLKGREHKRGGSFLKGNHHSAREQLKKGETGRYEKLLNQNKRKGHKGAIGNDSHGKRGKNTSDATEGGGGKHWIYHHGYPPKNANLVVIDRREVLGPRFYV